jgi:cation diffusion facilitator family transporter
MDKKVKVARLSIASNTFLIIIKLIVGLFSGSVSIVSEAIHSSMDLLASIIAFFSVKVSDTPADKRHPYGHGKYENVSGVIEAALIFVAAFWIIIEAVKKISSQEPLENMGWGMVVMFVSAGVNFLVSRKLYKVAKETNSIALEADALHLKTDVLTSAGVGVGLFLLWITGITILDPIVAILVALFILWESFQLMRNAFFPLVDAAMPDNEIKAMDAILEKRNVRYHDLKTRKAGNYRFADMHLEMPAQLSLQEVHDICDIVEDELKESIPNLEIVIHVEPIKHESIDSPKG